MRTERGNTSCVIAAVALLTAIVLMQPGCRRSIEEPADAAREAQAERADAVSELESASAPNAAGTAATDTATNLTVEGAIADPLTPDSDPKGVIAARKAILKDINRVDSELTALARDMRRGTQDFYRSNPEAVKLVAQVREIEKAVREKVANVPGREDTRGRMREMERELRKMDAEIERLEAHSCPLCDGSRSESSDGAEKKTAAEHLAERKAALAEVRSRRDEVHKATVALQKDAGRAEGQALEADPELDSLLTRAKDVSVKLAELVEADPEIGAMMRRRAELTAERAALVQQRDSAGNAIKPPLISKLSKNNEE